MGPGLTSHESWNKPFNLFKPLTLSLEEGGDLPTRAAVRLNEITPTRPTYAGETSTQHVLATKSMEDPPLLPQPLHPSSSSRLSSNYASSKKLPLLQSTSTFPLV